jgi:CRISPR-associated endonuclease/helicase Cas3
MGEGIARVFFRQGEVGYQLLSRHQALVTTLLEKWREGEGPLELSPQTKAKVFLAARHHDDGKRSTFKISQGAKGLNYGFPGHRFRLSLEVDDPYAQALILGHHDYSTREVVNLATEFVAEGLGRRFAEDLFLLMMADQLEAELAVRLFEGKEGEVRPFVEFDLLPLSPGASCRFALDPWPFSQEVTLTFVAYFHPYRGEEPSQVESWGRLLASALEQGQQPPDFQKEEKTVHLVPFRQHKGHEAAQDAAAFYGLFGLTPSPFQEEVFRLAQGDPAHLLVAPTGTGKTEATAFPALARGERLVVVLPTRSLVDDLEERFCRYLRTLAKREGRSKALIVDTGHRQMRLLFHADGREETKREQHLYHGDVILTTLDKLLYRYFGYAAGVKSYAFPKRIHDGRTLFVFDEVHLYEATAWVGFRNLVAALAQGGVRFWIMSATIPKAYQKELERYLEGSLTHPQGSRPSRLFHYFPEGDLQALAKENQGRRVLLVVEEVRHAVKLYQVLKGEGVLLYHGRLAEGPRRRVFQELKERDKGKKPYLLITTPAIEVGVDLDAEVLLTTLCPPENLLQRLGRVNRRGQGRGEAYLVGSTYPEYLGTLPEGYLELLRQLHGQDLASGGEERLRQAISYPKYVDPRAETLFSMLREYVYQLDLTQEPLHRKGFVATRSWTPTVRLRAGQDEVEIPVDHLVGKKDELVPTKVWERVWPNREAGEGNWAEPLLRSGELYGRELVVDYPFPYDPQLGFFEIPKVFQGFHRREDPQKVYLLYSEESPSSAQGTEVLDSDQISKRRVLLWYLGESAWREEPQEPIQEEGSEEEED